MAPPLILGSSSRYRAELLARLGLPFVQLHPEVDETPGAAEAPAALARRLARAKGEALEARRAGGLLITSDQVAAVRGEVLGKPGDAARAAAQLARCSGETVIFHTALRLAGPGGVQEHLDRTRVRFRSLDAAEIARYVARDQPLDCAGSFRAEGLGVSLFEALSTQDPTAIVGLPLIALAAMLRREGLALP